MLINDPIPCTGALSLSRSGQGFSKEAGRYIHVHTCSYMQCLVCTSVHSAHSVSGVTLYMYIYNIVS